MESIFYGVFAGTQESTSGGIPTVPIIDLGVFSRLVDWSFAASHLITAGNGHYARNLATEELKDQVKGPKAADDKTMAARAVNKLARLLGTYTDHVQVSQASGLPRVTSDLLASLNETRENFTPGPFRSLIDRIEADLLPLAPSDPDLVYFYIAQWCYRHGLVQQSATILQEGLLCFFMFKLGFSERDSYLRENRVEIQSALNAFCYDQRDGDGKGTWPIHKQRTKEEVSRMFLEYAPLTKHWLPLAEVRNKLNHAGMSPTSMPPDKLKRTYQELLDAVMTIVGGGSGATTDA